MRALANPQYNVLTDTQAADFAEVLWTLGNAHRLRIISLILHAPDGLRNARIVEQTGLSRPAVSHHMKLLTAAGLVERPMREESYKVVPGALDYVASFLAGPR